MERLVSGLGILSMMFAAWLMCPRDVRKHIAYKTVLTGFVVLMAFAFLVLKTPVRGVFTVASDFVDRLLSFSKEGATFVFGSLVQNHDAFGFIFAFQILPTIIFFAALMSLLYHVRIMPIVIRAFGKALSKILGTSGAESFSTVADIFVGPTEAPLAIRPYLAKLTRSEMNACMVAGFATTSGGVLAAYVGLLHDFVPDIAGHLIACSVMCAPASLVIAKLMLPETEQSETAGMSDIDIPTHSANAIDAIAVGTGDGLRLAANVGAMLIACLAIVSLLNYSLQSLGQFLFHAPISLEQILGYVFAPLSWLMGVPYADIFKVGNLIGQKTVLNEFVAYSNMSQALRADPTWLSERARLIASYALCGFANFGAIGIQIGGYAGLAPERRADLSRLAFKSMIGGLLTTCLVASVAGLLM